MDTRSINNRLKRYAEFVGTFPCDKIEITIRRPFGVIVNTDKSTSKGSHWVGIFVDANCNAEYFDSFGLPPMNKEIVDYLNKISLNWKYNPFHFQNYNTDTCGNYCVYFVEQRIQGLNFCDVISLLSNKNHTRNDAIIKDLSM